MGERGASSDGRAPYFHIFSSTSARVNVTVTLCPGRGKDMSAMDTEAEFAGVPSICVENRQVRSKGMSDQKDLHCLSNRNPCFGDNKAMFIIRDNIS